MGVFNRNLFNPAECPLMFNFCHRLNISVVHNSLPAHHVVRYGSTSLLDYFLIADIELSASGQFQLKCICHPTFIYVALTTCLRKVDTCSDIGTRVAAYDFNGICNTSDANNQINILNGDLCLIHEFIPKSWSL